MSDAPRSTRPLWVAIAVLAVGLGVALYFLVDRSPAPSASAPPASAPTPPAAQAPATQPTQPSPFAPDPKEAAARERLLVISHALDLHFRQRYDFPDRLEVLIANDLLKPVDLDDPWHRPVDYTRVAKERFKLCSRGPDATSWTDDDICIGPGGRDERPGR
ncbi:MAG: hypothetical protein U1F43_18890 [Myxococcota bacterium]